MYEEKSEERLKQELGTFFTDPKREALPSSDNEINRPVDSGEGLEIEK
ncbi:hypothetical protein JOC77_000867 [Peribacillus deserti]|uniref:Uncharacterized protein n=1 Tax=Peribacillus deserti TaxID=673318 RepID=A0ABS2QE62_9BACI|nr:hypothetical protein [Peribacillus deserti]MBM7691462.1 hypothetical protein [Peribacillus deserti]